MSETSPNTEPHIIVLGAGVIGLTTALKAQEQGYRVTLIAEHLPGDEKSINYCSPWAGAHHVSTYGVNDLQQTMETQTFHKMWEMSHPSHPASYNFMRIPQYDYYIEAKDVNKMNLEEMPNFRILEQNELHPGTKQGVYFETVTIDTSSYLPYLLNTFLSLGGTIHRQRISHLSELSSPSSFSPSSSSSSPSASLPSNSTPPPPPKAILNCTGLGSKSLGGVKDEALYPIRGQVVTIDAGHVRVGKTIAEEGGTWTYIIPRPNGKVILGGYKTENDWTSIPLPSHTTSILTRCLSLYPDLVPISKRSDVENPTVDELREMVVEEGCGLRPARKGGIRIESEVLEMDGRRVVVVHHYGHGGSGYQSSFGSAEICLQELSSALQRLSG